LRDPSRSDDFEAERERSSSPRVNPRYYLKARSTTSKYFKHFEKSGDDRPETLDPEQRD